VIFRNIQRFVTYLLSCNLSEVLVAGVAILVGLPLPLMPLQILFFNLVTDVFPAFALGVGEESDKILQRPPRDPGKPIVTRICGALPPCPRCRLTTRISRLVNIRAGCRANRRVLLLRF